MSSAAPYRRRWQALIVLAFSLLVVTVGNTILNVSPMRPRPAAGTVGP